jgi:hypothetical protein
MIPMGEVCAMDSYEILTPAESSAAARARRIHKDMIDEIPEALAHRALGAFLMWCRENELPID